MRITVICTLLSLFFFGCKSVKAQVPTISCNQSTLAVNQIFYPNTTTNYTNTSVFMEVLYLCGPNTIVYDTSFRNISATCRVILLNPGTFCKTTAPGCENSNYVLAKAGSTIVIGENAAPPYIHYEPGATIIDLSASAPIVSCSLISFPNINCSTDPVEKRAFLNSRLLIVPSSTADYVELITDDSQLKNQFLTYVVSNALGQTVKEIQHVKQPGKTENFKIPTSDLPEGFYTLSLKAKNSLILCKKFVIIR